MKIPKRFGQPHSIWPDADHAISMCLNAIELRKIQHEFLAFWDPDFEKKIPKYENRIDLERSGPSSFDCSVNLGIQFLETIMRYLNS